MIQKVRIECQSQGFPNIYAPHIDKERSFKAPLAYIHRYMVHKSYIRIKLKNMYHKEILPHTHTHTHTHTLIYYITNMSRYVIYPI